MFNSGRHANAEPPGRRLSTGRGVDVPAEEPWVTSRHVHVRVEELDGESYGEGVVDPLIHPFL